MRKIAKLEINSHNIAFYNYDIFTKDLLHHYCKRLIQYDRKKIKEEGVNKIQIVKKSLFAASNYNHSEYRIHVNCKDDILNYLRNAGFPKETLDIQINEIPKGKRVDFKLIDNREPFDYQETIIDYLTQEGKTKTITLGTGDGKTFAAIRAINNISKRTMVVILGRYVDKWIKDFEDSFELKKGDLIVIRGSKDLISVMNLAIANELNAKIIICTSSTVQRYIKNYEQNGDRGYPIDPGELYQKLDIGVKLIDECHQFFHLNFNMDLYTHVEKAIFLSATLEPSDSFLKKMYQIIYPFYTRFQGKRRDKYIDVIALAYKIIGRKRVRIISGGAYSHVAFENQILQNRKLKDAYLNMIWDITKNRYIEIKQSGQKMLIFASTINMCEEIRDYIQLKDSSLTIAKYTAEDPKEHLHEREIVVSTLGSAGTAVDIIDLKTCLMTVSIASKQQNIQALGRLRKLVNYPNDNPEFIYLYSPDITKQNDYHKAKYEIFKGLCRTHTRYETSYCLNYIASKASTWHVPKQHKVYRF